MSDLATLGRAMREAQRRYFRARTSENLVASKVAEKAFDDALAAEQEAGGWQPIATAPLEERIVLCQPEVQRVFITNVGNEIYRAELERNGWLWMPTPPPPGGPHG